EVNGVPLTAPYARGNKPKAVEPFDVRVPPHHLWVMGDNRENSADSRAHMGDPGGGFLPTSDVIGRAWVIVWPPGRMSTIDRPDTFDNPALDNGSSAQQGVAS